MLKFILGLLKSYNLKFKIPQKIAHGMDKYSLLKISATISKIYFKLNCICSVEAEFRNELYAICMLSENFHFKNFARVHYHLCLLEFL